MNGAANARQIRSHLTKDTDGVPTLLFVNYLAYDYACYGYFVQADVRLIELQRDWVMKMTKIRMFQQTIITTSKIA